MSAAGNRFHSGGLLRWSDEVISNLRHQSGIAPETSIYYAAVPPERDRAVKEASAG